MTAYKPRNSILSMFDPLKSPSTPRRDSSSSPESGTSDKENDNPPGDLTIFFNRIYTASKTAQPKTPRGQLIDFGDPNSDEECEQSLPVFDDLSNKSENGPSGSMTVKGKPTRRPLAEIDIEDTPKPRESFADVLTVPTASLDELSPIRSISVAPRGAPLAEVINSINLSSITISDPVLPQPQQNLTPTHEEDQEENDQENVEDTIAIPICIQVSSPTLSEGHSLTEADLPPTSESPTDRLFASSAMFVPPLRRSPPAGKLRINDPRRISVDLNASFSMQIQSPEMSFDLLNDKISFLGGHAGDSFCEDEPEFDMELVRKKMMEAIIEDVDEREHSVSPVVPEALSTIIDTPTSTASPVFSMPPSNQKSETASTRASPHVTPSLATTTLPSSFLPWESSSPVARVEEVKTPAPVPVSPEPAVPALRIIKKTWKVHGRTDSNSTTTSLSSSLSSARSRAPSTSSTVSSGDRSPSPREDATNPPALSVEIATAPRPAKTVIRGVQRPPITAETVPASKTAGPRTSAASTDRTGPSRFAGIQRPNVRQGEKAMPSQSTTSRLQRSASAADVSKAEPAAKPKASAVPRPVVAKATSASGLKPPTRLGVSASASTSALPRPVSRLPSLGSINGGLKAKDAKGTVARPSAKRAF